MPIHFRNLHDASSMLEITNFSLFLWSSSAASGLYIQSRSNVSLVFARGVHDLEKWASQQVNHTHAHITELDSAVND